MNKYEIRKMTPLDVDLLQQISIETFTDTFGKDNSPEHLAAYLRQAYAPEKLTEELKEKETDFLLVSIDQEPAGYLKLNIGTSQSEEMDDHFLEIERIYVRKKFKHQGIGTFLLDTAIEKAKEKQKKLFGSVCGNITMLRLLSIAKEDLPSTVNMFFIWEMIPKQTIYSSNNYSNQEV